MRQAEYAVILGPLRQRLWRPASQVDRRTGCRLLTLPGMGRPARLAYNGQAMLAFLTLDEFNFYPTLAHSPGVSLVLFDSPGCGACQVAKQRLPAWLAGTVQQLYRVDVAVSTGLAREYEVFHLPALFLFVDGQYHAAVQAALTAPALQAAIAMLIRQPAQEAP